MLQTKIDSMAAVALVLALPAWATAQVTISGGRDKVSLNTYRWTLTNGSDKAIMRFEFPRYMVQDFDPPEDWSARIVKQDAEGRPLHPQRIVYEAKTPRDAIRPGGTAEFGATITMDKATPGRQTALVAFTDGTTLEVPGLEIPWDYPWLEKNALLIGMGTLFALFLLVQALRGRKSARTSASGHSQ